MTAPVDTHPKGRNRLRVRFMGSAVPKAGALIRSFLNLYRERQARKPKAFEELEAQTASGYASALARHRVKQDRALVAAVADELRRDLEAGKHANIPDRSEVVATVLWGRAIKRMRVNG